MMPGIHWPLTTGRWPLLGLPVCELDTFWEVCK